MDKFHPLTLPAIEHEAVEDLGCELERRQLPFGCTPDAATFVDILDLYPKETPRWSRKNASELPDLFPLTDGYADVKTPKLRVFFFRDANFLLERTGDKYHFAHNSPTVQWMQQRFGVSPLFFRAAAFPIFTPVEEHMCIPYRDHAGRLTRLDGYYYIRDFSYPGHHLIWFSHSLGGHPVSTYITYNLPEAAWHAIVTCAPQMLPQPLSVDLFFSRSLLRRNQQALWENQDAVFQLEEDHQLKSSLTPETAAAAITQLHGVARAMHRFRADLCDLRRTVDFLCSIADRISSHSRQASTGEMELSIESLEYLKSQIEVLLDQQTAGRERIATQIALFFNLSNQLDSRTNLDIARLTSEISVSTQRDSSSMITVAIVTMFFLPGTFISGFFSMVFVGSTPDAYGHPTIVVGPQVWIYFLATVVLTALVFCIWRLWFKQRAEQQARDLRSRELSRGVHLGIREINGTDVETETPARVARNFRQKIRQLAGGV